MKWFLIIMAALIILKRPELVNQLINSVLQVLNGP